MANEAASAVRFRFFMVSAPVVLWVTGVVVNYNTRFSVVNRNFVKFHMTYGLCRAALCWWGPSVAPGRMRLCGKRFSYRNENGRPPWGPAVSRSDSPEL